MANATWENEITEKCNRYDIAIRLATDAAAGLLCGVDPTESDRRRIATAKRCMEKADHNYKDGEFDKCCRNIAWAIHYARTSNPGIHN